MSRSKAKPRGQQTIAQVLWVTDKGVRPVSLKILILPNMAGSPQAEHDAGDDQGRTDGKAPQGRAGESNQENAERSTDSLSEVVTPPGQIVPESFQAQFQRPVPPSKTPNFRSPQAPSRSPERSQCIVTRAALRYLSNMIIAWQAYRPVNGTLHLCNLAGDGCAVSSNGTAAPARVLLGYD